MPSAADALPLGIERCCGRNSGEVGEPEYGTLTWATLCALKLAANKVLYAADRKKLFLQTLVLLITGNAASKTDPTILMGILQIVRTWLLEPAMSMMPGSTTPEAISLTEKVRTTACTPNILSPSILIVAPHACKDMQCLDGNRHSQIKNDIRVTMRQRRFVLSFCCFCLFDCAGSNSVPATACIPGSQWLHKGATAAEVGDNLPGHGTQPVHISEPSTGEHRGYTLPTGMQHCLFRHII